MLNNTWVLATYKIFNDKYVIYLDNWFGITPQSIVLSKEEFFKKTEEIKNRDVL